MVNTLPPMYRHSPWSWKHVKEEIKFVLFCNTLLIFITTAISIQKFRKSLNLFEMETIMGQTWAGDSETQWRIRAKFLNFWNLLNKYRQSSRTSSQKNLFMWKLSQFWNLLWLAYPISLIILSGWSILEFLSIGLLLITRSLRQINIFSPFLSLSSKCSIITLSITLE